MKAGTGQRRWFAGLLAVLLAACGGGGSAGSGQGGFSSVASIELSPTSASIGISQSTALAAVARDARGTALTGVSLAWQSSDSTVASVAAGLVTGVAAGSAAITASAIPRLPRRTQPGHPAPASSARR